MGSGFTWYQTQVIKVKSDSNLVVGVTEIGGDVTRLGDSISEIKNTQNSFITQAQLKTQLSEIISESAKVNEALKSEYQQLKDDVESININMANGVNDFLLKDVEQLFHIAKYNLELSDNPKAAILALSLADEQLKKLDDAKYSVVRHKLNEEIILLENVKRLDIESYIAKLNAFSRTVHDLPIALNSSEPLKITSSQELPENLSWKTELVKVWNDVKELVLVKNDKAPKVMLVPEQRYFLDQNLQLTFNKAEIALLQRRESVFRQNIESAILWLNEYFDITDDRIVEIISDLEGMKSKEVFVQMPDISDSYQSFQSLKES